MCGSMPVTLMVRVRELAARIQCQNNLRHVGMAMQTYATNLGEFPSATIPAPGRPPQERFSWLVALVPYIQADTLYSELDTTKGWEAQENRFAAVRGYRVYRCPVCPEKPPVSIYVPTDFLGIAGLGPDAASLSRDDPRAGLFGYEGAVRGKDVLGSQANTLAVVETGQGEGAWTAGGPATVRGVDPAARPPLGPGRPFGGNHPGVTDALFLDGSVHFLSDSIDPAVFESLARLRGDAVRPPDN
jgi:hypothetical protein